MVQLSHPYMTTGKTIVLTIWTSAGKVMSLLSLSSFHVSRKNSREHEVKVGPWSLGMTFQSDSYRSPPGDEQNPRGRGPDKAERPKAPGPSPGAERLSYEQP